MATSKKHTHLRSRGLWWLVISHEYHWQKTFLVVPIKIGLQVARAATASMEDGNHLQSTAENRMMPRTLIELDYLFQTLAHNIVIRVREQSSEEFLKG
jgi:hypothetical protein